MVDGSFKTIYITIDPKDHDAGVDRVRRAVRKSFSSDYLLPKDVPWHNVMERAASERFIDKLVASKKQNKEDQHNTKKKKKKDPNDRLKLDFYKLLNVRDPGDGCSGFNVSKINAMMDDMPSLATDKYLFAAFAEPITALHMLCAVDAPLSCIKRCFQHNVAAVRDNSSAIGSPLHYACWFNANVKTVRYIASKVDDANVVLLLQNRAKRTPLHLACMRKADADLVVLLTAACPAAATMKDKDGMTPLHLAMTVENPVLAVIEDLTEVYPEAGSIQGASGSTPLHLALANPEVDTDILKDLVASNVRALRIRDAAGDTPLHVATAAGRSLKEMKLLYKKYPHAARVKNEFGETPYKMAKVHKADKDILKLLKPTAVV